MKYIKIEPPGTWCLYESLFEILHGVEGRHFLEVGCGDGNISLKLLEKGYSGVGIDFSPIAIQECSEKLTPYIKNGKYQLHQTNMLDNPPIEDNFDFAMSLFVIEHVKDDVGFLKLLKSRVRVGGHIIISVPSRTDKWSIEDDTAGHYRRYNREDLFGLIESAGLKNPEVWSLAIPISNIVFGLSNMAIKRSNEKEKRHLSIEDQTKSSGVRNIPFKTVFPPIFKIILNRVTLQPMFITQRFFYHTGLGLTMLAKARCV